MFTKLCTAQEAAALVKDNDFLVCGGNMNSCLAEEICIAGREIQGGRPSAEYDDHVRIRRRRYGPGGRR